MPTLEEFYNITKDDLDPNIPNGAYCLKVTRHEVGEWEDGRQRVDLSTEVVSGDFAGRFGPRVTWTLGEFEGDGWATTSDQARNKMIVQANAIKDGDVLISQNGLSDEDLLDEVATQVKGCQFVATVERDKNDYPRVKRVFPMSAPPKSFNGMAPKKKFSVENV